MSIRFLQYSISPIIAITETMFNRSLLLNEEKEQGYFFKFNTDDVLKSTQEERYNALHTGINAGILTINEARVKENLTPIPNDYLRFSLGNIFYSPKNQTMFIPNMSTSFDAETNKILSSPELAKEELNNPNNEEPKPTTADEGDNE